MRSTIKKKKNYKSHEKCLFNFLLGGEKWVLPSRIQKNNKSHVKVLYNN